MGLDATIPLATDDFTFKVIKVPGADSIDLQQMLDDEGEAAAIIGNEETGRA
jgi:hypothetical protein